MVIDFHTHCFPDRIAERAMETLSHASALKPHTDGTLKGLKDIMKRDGVDVSVVMSIATNPKQQTAVNDFAASIQGDNVFAFGSVHPDAKNALEELERIKELGLKGVKFHPEYQSFFVDDEKMKPIYKKISDLGLITLFHAGEDYGYMPPYHATPKRLLKALSWFSSPVVAAHWGSQAMGEETLKYLCGRDVYFDTAFGYGSGSKQMRQAILEKHGADKVLFASDCPWHAPGADLYLLSCLGLSKTEEEMIKSTNAKKLLGI